MDRCHEARAGAMDDVDLAYRADDVGEHEPDRLREGHGAVLVVRVERTTRGPGLATTDGDGAEHPRKAEGECAEREDRNGQPWNDEPCAQRGLRADGLRQGQDRRLQQRPDRRYDRAGGQSEHDARRGQSGHRDQLDPTDLAGARSLWAAGHREEADAERFDEAGDREGSGQGERAAGHQRDDGHERLAQRPTKTEQRLHRQPLAREPVERGQSGDGRAANEERDRGDRHPVDQAPEALDLPGPHRAVDRPGAEEQEGLEHGVIDHVEQRRTQSQDDDRVGTRAAARQRDPQSEQDDPDVLDAVVREQPFEIVLHQRVQHTQTGARRAEGNDNGAPPRWAGREPLETQTHQSVDPELDHHARHERRDRGRRDRMGPREPHVERDHSRLGPEADQPEGEDEPSGQRIEGARGRGPVIERQRSAVTGEQQERHGDGGGRGVSHHQVDPSGTSHLGPAVVSEHQRERSERHRLPGDEEREGVAGQRHAEHREHEKADEQAAAGKGQAVMVAVPDRIERDRCRDREDERPEEQAQAVEAQAQRKSAERVARSHELAPGLQRIAPARARAACRRVTRATDTTSSRSCAFSVDWRSRSCLPNTSRPTSRSRVIRGSRIR